MTILLNPIFRILTSLIFRRHSPQFLIFPNGNNSRLTQFKTSSNVTFLFTIFNCTYHTNFQQITLFFNSFKVGLRLIIRYVPGVFISRPSFSSKLSILMHVFKAINKNKNKTAVHDLRSFGTSKV
ncbi:hypothetical protein WA026_002684 [Henosepilachna vigintioctopunctata]|uniref:Uncharacterized protein n=1 Tax=Henosepilachna vigintioctopunctata TaxID=420089 RepID=A0AAW1U4P4_9CUCU